MERALGPLDEERGVVVGPLVVGPGEELPVVEPVVLAGNEAGLSWK